MLNPRKIDNALEKSLATARVFLHEHANEKGIQDTYGYFTSHPVAGLNQKRLRLMLTLMEDRSENLKRPLRILDLACGGGLIACAAAAMNHNVLGMDLSAQEIHLAELFRNRMGLETKFRQTDLLKNPDWEQDAEKALGGRPDFIILAYALHHLPGVEGFIERLSHWLSPDTQLLINEENPNSPLFRLKHMVRTFIQKDTDVEWHRTYAGWKKALEAGKFRVAPAQGIDVVPKLGQIFPLRCWSLVFTASKG